jgi:FkbM family methyltransferase
VSIPLYQITYAQNREDLILAGILRSIDVGFYVDVGANHPQTDSVTKIFYDKGWSGINVEPQEHLVRELCRQRPRDINIQAGAASLPGTLRLRSFPAADGLSTFNTDLKRMYDSHPPDPVHEEISVEVVSLGEILLKHRPLGDIHFLKVDAEGMELEVLLGNAWERFRPWVLCLEGSLNGARTAAIKAFLGAWNYAPVFWDGVNDYFVAGERRSVWDGFSYAREIIMRGIPLYAGLVPYLSATDQPTALAQSAPPVSPTEATQLRELLALDGEAFVRAAYATVLSRASDAEGLKHYLAELNAGVSKTAILARLRNSGEGRRQRGGS